LQYNGRSGVSAWPLVERDDGVVPVAAGVHDDEGLVHALQQGDPGAPATLFDRYGPYIQRVLVRFIGYAEPERADLLHDVFIRALERIGELKNPRALKAWLVGITVFTAQEWIRRRKRQGPPLAPEHGAEREGHAASPEVHEAVRSFFSLIDRFGNEERTVFILRVLEGMNLDEVAEACGISVSTARRRISRAEKRFSLFLPQYPALLERLLASKKR
jgi:RNA polymerase sigma-70 factor (ECF subfamily)